MKKPSVDLSALRSAFSHRQYAIYTAGNAVSLVGYWMQKLAVGWLAWQLTESGFWLGAVAFADLFPALLLGPFAGVIADRKDKKTIILIAQVFLVAQAAALAILLIVGIMDIWLLLAIAFVMGMSFAMHESARSAIVIDLVPMHDVATAVAFGAVIFNTARFVGPALAGVVITYANIETVALVHAIAALTMMATLLATDVTVHRTAVHESELRIFSQLREGIVLALTHHAVAPMLMVMLAATLFVRPVYELMPGVAASVFERGAGGLSIMMSALGVGAVVAGLLMAQRGATQHFFHLALMGAAGTATALIVFTAIDMFWLALPLLFVLGYFMATCSTSVQIVIQLSVEPSFRARVLSLWTVIIRGGPAIGTPIMGGLATYVGFQWPLAAGGLICLLVTLLVFRRRREFVDTKALSAPHTTGEFT